MSATGWLTEKTLGFKWPKTTQIALKILRFFQNTFKYVQNFSCLRTFFLLEEFFHKNPEHFERFSSK